MALTKSEMLARCTIRIRGRAVNVDDQGVVRVYDEALGDYSDHHDLTESEIARAHKAAAAKEWGSADGEDGPVRIVWYAASDDVVRMGPYPSQVEAWEALRIRVSDHRVHVPGAYVWPELVASET